MLFRCISVRLENPLRPLPRRAFPDIPISHPKPVIAYLCESPRSRATRLGVQPDQLPTVDQIKALFKIKGSRAATLYHTLCQYGLLADGAFPKIVRFHQAHHADCPTIESAIPAYLDYRDSLVPTTKEWVSLIVGALPLSSIQPQFENDLWDWIQSAMGPTPLSQTDLPDFLQKYQKVLIRSLHTANTVGRFSDPTDTVLHQLIPTVIEAFRDAIPNWKMIQSEPTLEIGIQHRTDQFVIKKTTPKTSHTPPPPATPPRPIDTPRHPDPPRLFDGKLMSGARFFIPRTKLPTHTADASPAEVDEKEALMHRYTVWRSLGIDSVGLDWLESRFQTITQTSPDFREVAPSLEHYITSIRQRIPTAFTLALSDYIQHQSNHHRAIYRELGIHREDMRRLQADLPISTPDDIIRAKTHHHLTLGLTILRLREYAKMQTDSTYWENQFQTWPPQVGESETAQTTQFLDAVRSSIATEIRLTEEQLKPPLPDAVTQQHDQLVETYRKAGLSESDIPAIQARWPLLPLPEAFIKYNDSWHRFRVYQDAGIPESECLLVDTTYWKEGRSPEEAITAYQGAKARFVEYKALGRSDRVCPMIDTHWKPGMTATATIEEYDIDQKFLDESAKRHTRYAYYESQGYDELCLSTIDHLWHGEPESLDVAIQRFEAFKKKGEQTVRDAINFYASRPDTLYRPPSPHPKEWEPTPTYEWKLGPPDYYYGHGYSWGGGVVNNGLYF